MSEQRLYGVPDAEELYFDVQPAIEAGLCWSDPEDSDPELVQIEEWTVHPPRHHLPSAKWVLEDILERTLDVGELTSDGHYFDTGDAELLAAAEQLLDAIAAKVTWRQADRMVSRRNYIVRSFDDFEAIDAPEGGAS